MQQSLVTQISPVSRSPVTLLMLEQQKAPACAGQVSKAALVRYLANLMFGKNDELGIDCGVDADGDVNVLINVYPYQADLNYSLKASYGELGESSVAEIQIKETIQLHLQTEVSVRYPVQRIISADWLNDAYAADFALLSPPPEILIGDDLKTVSSSVPCYGSVQVVYSIIVHVSLLTLPRRLDTNENGYSSTVYAIYEGGLVWLPVSIPETAELTGGDCAYGGSNLKLNDRNSRRPKPEGTGAGKLIRIDYCTQKKLSETVLI